MSSHRPTVPLQIDRQLAAKARDLGVDMTQAAEVGDAKAVRAAEANAWLDENRHALESSNAFVECHGLPLSKLRLFSNGTT